MNTLQSKDRLEKLPVPHSTWHEDQHEGETQKSQLLQPQQPAEIPAKIIQGLRSSKQTSEAPKEKLHADVT